MSPVHARLYEALGVGPEVSTEALKRAWRAWLLEHHPDKGGDPEYFHSVKEAFEYVCEHGGPQGTTTGGGGGRGAQGGPADGRGGGGGGAQDGPADADATGGQTDEEWGERVGWDEPRRQPPPRTDPPPPRPEPPPPRTDPPPPRPEPPPTHRVRTHPGPRKTYRPTIAGLGRCVGRAAGPLALVQGLVILAVTPSVLAGETDHIALARVGLAIRTLATLPTVGTVAGFLVWWAATCHRRKAAGLGRPGPAGTILWLLPLGPLVALGGVRRVLADGSSRARPRDWLLMLSGALAASWALIPGRMPFPPLPMLYYETSLLLLLVLAGLWRLVTVVQRATGQGGAP